MAEKYDERKIARGEFKDYYSITLQGWMVNKLDLHGNKLLVYAMVYTYSMLPDSEFAYGEKVLSALCNVSVSTIKEILNQLAEERLILVTELEYRGRKYRTYRTNFKKVYACLNTKKDKTK